MEKARGILRQRFGYADFRAGQDALIEQLLGGRDCLGVMPTGAGKSLCYQVPALVFEGLAIVISPLISLMKDQVDALRSNGIAADCLNSSLAPAQRSAVLKRVAQGACRILYVAPERLGTAEFARLIAQAPVAVSLVAVDEAHCISQWGHDFRPSYRDIPCFIDGLNPRPVVGAYTATATQRVRTDIEQLLRLRDPFVLVTGFDRANLHFAVKRPRDKAATLLSFIREKGEASGIVYCATRRTVEELCEELCDAGFAATRYHAGLGEDERRVNQDDFLYDRKAVMVATNAFGMGIDKSNVGYVVHYNMPQNLESYYQEAGRAGRDGSPATCLLLYEPADVQTNTYLITHSDEGRGGDRRGGLGATAGFGGGAGGFGTGASGATFDVDDTALVPIDPVARDARISNDLALLRQMTFYATTNDCLRGFILRYFGEAAPVFCGDCSNCLTTFEAVDVTVEAQKIISCVFRLRERGRSLGKTLVTDILRGSRNKRILELGLDTLSTYGIMADCSTARLRALLDILIEKGYLGLTETEYPVVLFNERSRTLLAPDASFVVKLPKEKPPAEKDERAEKDGRGGRASGPTRGRRTSTDAASVWEADIDPQLFEHLRGLRSRLAREAGLPPYIVFADAALREMAARKPQTPDELLQISGVGTVKLERYGDAFLACIQEYLAQA